KRLARQAQPHPDSQFERYAAAILKSPEESDEQLLPEVVEDQSVRENDSILNDPEKFADALEHAK
ncbi:MAG: hypothetical protein K2H85_06720, partial [Allobaculum sp.]|nr:hypothetical protein [Allobaculum sp.]